MTAGDAARKRILVIDDDDEISSLVREILEDEGHVVLTAADGAEALELLAGEGMVVDLILLDMRMPHVNGWEFAARYRQRLRPHAPLVAMTAAQHVEQWAQEIGADGVLAKPFDLDDLLGVVDRFAPKDGQGRAGGT